MTLSKLHGTRVETRDEVVGFPRCHFNKGFSALHSRIIKSDSKAKANVGESAAVVSRIAVELARDLPPLLHIMHKRKLHGPEGRDNPAILAETQLVRKTDFTSRRGLSALRGLHWFECVLDIDSSTAVQHRTQSYTKPVLNRDPAVL